MAIPILGKRCSCCKLVKPPDEWYRRRKNGRWVPSAHCKACTREKLRKYDPPLKGRKKKPEGWCPRCKQVKLPDQWTKGAPYCKPCVCEWTRNRYHTDQANREKKKRAARSFYYREKAADPEKVLTRSRKRKKKYRSKPGVMVNEAAKRRAWKKPGNLTQEEWLAIVAKFKGRCYYCKRGFPLEELTRDHVVPLSKGGPHVADNIVPACLSCNSSKGDRFTELF